MDGRIEISSRYRDGGRDVIGVYRWGAGADPILIDFSLEAKCGIAREAGTGHSILRVDPAAGHLFDAPKARRLRAWNRRMNRDRIKINWKFDRQAVKLNLGQHDDPVLMILRRVLQEAWLAAKERRVTAQSPPLNCRRYGISAASTTAAPAGSC